MQTCCGSEAQYQIMSAISGAYNGVYPPYTCFAFSSSPLKRILENSVSADPGCIAVTLILCGRRSIRIDWLRASTANFVAQYTFPFSYTSFPAIEPRFIMCSWFL